MSSSHLSVLERKNGTLAVTAYPLPGGGEVAAHPTLLPSASATKSSQHMRSSNTH